MDIVMMTMITMTLMMTMQFVMLVTVHLSIRSISHGSRIEEFVAVEARETAGVVDVLATCHLRG